MSEVLEIPIDRIKVEEGHNPRSDFDLKSIEELSKSIAQRGVLQPISVRQEGEVYFLISGERRLRASQGVLKTIPAIVANGRSGDQGERLIDALIENIQRKDISVADEVAGYRRLKEDHGWDAKRIAHETGFPQNRVTLRMALLALPQDAIDSAAALPERSRKVLIKLAGLHPGGAGEIAKWLRDQAAEVQSDFGKQPCATLRGWKCISAVPFMVEGGYYKADGFQLDEEVHKLREELDKGYGVQITVTPGLLNRAAQLQACVEVPDGRIAGGWDVCCELAATAVKQTAADLEKRTSEAEAWRDHGGSSSKVVVDPETGKVAEDERAKEIRSQRHKEQQESREKAIAFNDALGPELLQRCAKVDMTAGIARVLCHFALQADGDDWAERGLRYIHPNGRIDEGGKVAKYVEGPAAAKLLKDWVGSPRKAEEIIGRTLCVILASRLADADAVAQSNKRGVGASSYGVVWDEAVIDSELDKLIRKVLPKAVLDRIDERAASSSSEVDDQEDDAGDDSDLEGHVSDDAGDEDLVEGPSEDDILGDPADE